MPRLRGVLHWYFGTAFQATVLSLRNSAYVAFVFDEGKFIFVRAYSRTRLARFGFVRLL